MRSLAIFLCILLLYNFSTLRAQVNVVTQHNDKQRTGWNNREILLNTRNVRPGSFGKLFTLPIDDQMFAQPLIVTQVNMPVAGKRDILFAATVNNTVYAFDADSLRSAGPYWHVNLNPPGTRPPKNTDMIGACQGNYTDLANIGIVGTPVIDTLTNTIYLVTRSVTTTGPPVFSQYLHALDITTGKERTNSPVTITAAVSGTGEGSSGGLVPLNPQTQNQRAGLLLLNGTVYIAYGSHCDLPPYHGWILGYDAANLALKIVYCVTPDGFGGGIWLSGTGLAADASGNIYATTGNGTIGVGADPTNNRNRGESMIKLAPSGTTLSVLDYFAPYNYNTLINNDLDFGSTEVLLIPGMNRVLAGCKDGNLYLADVNNLGQWTSGQNNNVQTVPLGIDAHFHSNFGYYHGTAKEFVYTWPENTALKAFPVNRAAGILDVGHVVTAGYPGPIGSSGATFSSSSNGSVDSTAIVWITHGYNCDANHQVCPGIFRAVNANDVTQELWNSNMVPTDSIGLYAKFSAPTIANGKVYVATFGGQLMVYGSTNNAVDTCITPNIALGRPATSSSSLNTDYLPGKAFDGSMTTEWKSLPTDAEYLYVDLGQGFTICRVAIYWDAAYGRDYDIQVSDDASSWTIIASVRGNSTLQNFVNLQGAGRYVRMNGITRGTANGYGVYEMQVFGAAAGNCAAPANLLATNIQKNSTTLTWDAVPNATSYSIQYRNVSTTSWTTVTSNTSSVQVSALSCSSDYVFQVAVTCSGGLYSGYSSPVGFSTLYCSAACSTLPTRWTQIDIGSVGVAGQACFDGATFTLQGSGADIGGTADAFRFAYQTLNGDNQFIGRVVTQDATDPANKVGIMIRESLDPGARNAFVALSSGLGGGFQFRSTTDGNTSGFAASGTPAAPYWVKLVKTGSIYSGWLSPNGLSWTQAGTPVDLGFGAGGSTAYVGQAITSHNNAVLSTATVDNYSQTINLPIHLLAFTGQDAGQSVLLQWTTATEQNSDRFEVEKSIDDVHFSTLTTVTAAGNSSSERSYRAIDPQPLAGLDYYRLRLVDLDGRFTYSPLVLVHFGRHTAPVLFPNPASAYFTLVAGSDIIREVKVYDLTGRMTLQMLNNAVTLTIPCSRLSPGIYIVEVRTGGGRYIQKMMKN